MRALPYPALTLPYARQTIRPPRRPLCDRPPARISFCTADFWFCSRLHYFNTLEYVKTQLDGLLPEYQDCNCVQNQKSAVQNDCLVREATAAGARRTQIPRRHPPPGQPPAQPRHHPPAQPRPRPRHLCGFRSAARPRKRRVRNRHFETSGTTTPYFESRQPADSFR